ncbi:MAG: transporter substrate-binding domain-containing protein [Thiohalocapsa sp.]
MTRIKLRTRGRRSPHRRAGRSLLAAWAAAVLLWSVSASAETQTGFDDIQAILDRRALRVGLLKHDLPPFVETNDDGSPAGIDVLVAQILARRLGVAVDLRRTAETTDELIQQVAAGDADIGLSFLSRSSRRALRVRFSRPYVTEHPAFVINRSKALRYGVACPTEPEQVIALLGQDRDVGTLRGSVFEGILSGLGANKKTRAFRGVEGMLAAVESGDILGALGGEVALRHGLDLRPSLRIKVQICLVGAERERISVAIRPDAPNLANWIDIVLENIDLRVDTSGKLHVNSDWAR